MFRWLKKLFEAHPGRKGWQEYYWHNWADTLHVTADRYFEPTHRDQIAEIVRRARAEDPPARVRVVGNSYSWSKLVPTRDYLVCLKRMDRLIDINPNDKTVTVECGMSLGTLTDWLTRTGMAVQSPTVITYLSVGGMIAVGAHGSSTAQGPFPEKVITFSYVTADGEFGEVTDKESRPCGPTSVYSGSCIR